jgi:hypothetical protein
MPKTTKFSSSHNPKQGVLHPGDAFSVALFLLKPGTKTPDNTQNLPFWQYTLPITPPLGGFFREK